MSVSVIIKPKHNSPKFEIKKWLKSVPDESASKIDHEKFWRTEIEQYWVEGRYGLTGSHYSYVTAGTIKTMSGTSILPRWRDHDEWVISQDKEAADKGQNTIIVKRREFGLSSFFGGHLPVYTGLVNHGSTSLLTSADKPRVESLFNEKALVTYFGLNKYIRPGRISQRQGGFLHMGTLNKITHAPGGIDSKIICRETADSDKNAKAFENYRAMYIFLDELFRHDRASQVLRSSQACLRQGLSTKGHMVLGGSCGNMTREGAKEGEELWNDAVNLHMKTIFIPGTACIEEADELDSQGMPTGKKLNFCVNGHSDHKAAEDWILKTRERLGKAKDQRHLQDFMVEYPLTPEEVFQINSRGLLGDHIYSKLKESERKIKLGEFKEGRYSIKNSQANLRAEPDKNGKFYIVMPPVESGEYIAGCDPIPFGSAQVDKGSDHAVVIKDRNSEIYTAYYAERNLDADEVIGNTILLQELYRSIAFPTGAMMNPEMNRGEVLQEKYKQYGKLYLLCGRLEHLGIAYESNHAGYGWYNNDKTNARANNLMIEYLKKYGDQVGIMRMIEELRMWPNGNTDLVSAMLSCELLDKNLTEKYKVKYVPVKKQKKLIITRDAQGRTVKQWI